MTLYSYHVTVSVDVDGLKPDARVRLPGSEETVTLVRVTTGLLAEDELDGIEMIDELEELHFDGDARQFRLGVEAQRSQIAFAYEMAGLAVSSIRPLPHQLEAVYDCFLPQPRLRYLLADDPGAGKTIMAGLYMKELMLRAGPVTGSWW